MIQLYIASIESLSEEAHFQARIAEVPEERRVKIEKCKMRKDQERSLAAGLLVQHAWRQYLLEAGLPVEAMKVAKAAGGKPYCVNRPEFYYNVSHSGAYVACVSGDCPVGVDIQQRKDVDLKVAKRFFMEREYVELLRKQQDQMMTFCEMWAMKESYMKYTGRGIKQGMDTYYVDRENQSIEDQENGKCVAVFLSHDVEGYAVAVCTAERKTVMSHEIQL